MTIAATEVHRFTRDEYRQMAALGFFEGKRVELLEGEVLDMPPQTNRHALTITLINRYLTRHLKEEEYMVRCQCPLAVEEYSEPEPDFSVMRGKVEDLKDHPSTASLVVEVSVESLRRDRAKVKRYALAGVQEYWIIDVDGRQIIQHVGPRAITSQEDVGEYSTIRTLSAIEMIQCTTLPLPAQVVERLLPPY